MNGNDLALLEEEMLISSCNYVDDEYLYPYPGRMVSFCCWWDSDPALIKNQYQHSAASTQPGNFGMRQTFIYFMRPQDGMVAAYIAIIGR